MEIHKDHTKHPLNSCVSQAERGKKSSLSGFSILSSINTSPFPSPLGNTFIKVNKCHPQDTFRFKFLAKFAYMDHFTHPLTLLRTQVYLLFIYIPRLQSDPNIQICMPMESHCKSCGALNMFKNPAMWVFVLAKDGFNKNYYV